MLLGIRLLGTAFWRGLSKTIKLPLRRRALDEQTSSSRAKTYRGVPTPPWEHFPSLRVPGARRGGGRGGDRDPPEGRAARAPDARLPPRHQGAPQGGGPARGRSPSTSSAARGRPLAPEDAGVRTRSVDPPSPHAGLDTSEGGMILLETLIELKLFNSSFVEPILLLKIDEQLPVEQFEATVFQSTVPSPPLITKSPRPPACMGTLSHQDLLYCIGTLGHQNVLHARRAQRFARGAGMSKPMFFWA